MGFETLLQKVKYKCRVLWFPCSAPLTKLWFFTGWKWVGWMQSLIGFPWHGQGLTSERRKKKGKERLEREEEGGGNKQHGRRGKKAQTFASVCVAPVYRLNHSIVARGKWHMGASEIFCSDRFFYGRGSRPTGVQCSLHESASASSKAVISCSSQVPIPQPRALVC